MKTIITHSGGAHRDDFLSCCLALVLEDGCPDIERRDPTPEELADPEVLVLDVGGFYDTLNNFDHHQLSRGTKECALSLYSKNRLYCRVPVNELLATKKWLPPTVELDSCGPFQTAKSLGCSPKNIFELMSPIEESLLNCFQEFDSITKRNPIWDAMYTIGLFTLQDCLLTYNRLQELDEKVKVVEIKGEYAHPENSPIAYNFTLKGLYLPEKDLTGFNDWMEKNHPDAAFSISLDDRGEGMTLYRFNDNHHVDFSKLSSHPEVHFSHSNGFICKTKKVLPLQTCLSLVSKSIK